MTPRSEGSVGAVPSLRPVAAVFVVFGAFWGSWVVAAADVQRMLDLSHGGLGLLLSGALALAAVVNAVGGALSERLGTGPILAASLGGWGGLLLLSVLDLGPLVFGVVIVVIIAVGGLVDVVMNVAATAGLAHSPGALVRFHARFNVGAAIGAGGTGVLLGQALSWRWVWAGVGVCAFGLAIVCGRATLPAGGAGERMPLTGAIPLLRREGLLVVALAFAVGSMVEGGVELWGVLFLRTHVPAGLTVGASSAVAAYSIAAVSRVLLGPVASRRGAVPGVAVGAGLAAGGIVLIGFGPTAWVSGAGLVAAAAGISLCWPLLLAHASAGRARPGTVVGGVTAIGYLGFVVGPAIVGWVSNAAGLRTGLLFLAAAALFVAAGPVVSRRR